MCLNSLVKCNGGWPCRNPLRKHSCLVKVEVAIVGAIGVDDGMVPLVLEMDIVSRWSVKFWRHDMLELKRSGVARRRRKRPE